MRSDPAEHERTHVAFVRDVEERAEALRERRQKRRRREAVVGRLLRLSGPVRHLADRAARLSGASASGLSAVLFVAAVEAAGTTRSVSEAVSVGPSGSATFLAVQRWAATQLHRAALADSTRAWTERWLAAAPLSSAACAGLLLVCVVVVRRVDAAWGPIGAALVKSLVALTGLLVAVRYLWHLVETDLEPLIASAVRLRLVGLAAVVLLTAVAVRMLGGTRR